MSDSKSSALHVFPGPPGNRLSPEKITVVPPESRSTYAMEPGVWPRSSTASSRNPANSSVSPWAIRSSIRAPDSSSIASASFSPASVRASCSAAVSRSARTWSQWRWVVSTVVTRVPCAESSAPAANSSRIAGTSSAASMITCSPLVRAVSR